MIYFKRFAILLLILTCTKIHAQNLVRNGDFEAYTNPPGGSGLLLEDWLPGWGSYFTTPDYFSTVLWTPEGVLDYCGTLPRSGGGMVGGYQLGYFTSMPGYNREYIQGELSEPLKANTLYYAEMYVKPMLNSPVINFGIKNLGIVITNKHYTHYDSTDAFLIDEIPVVEYNTGVITDMSEWTKVSGCFIAKGGETKIIIGNFKKDAETDTAQLPGAFGEEQFHEQMSYYLFDDILVKEMPLAYILPGDITICRDSSVTLKAFPENGLSYTWNNGASSQSIQVNEAGQYSVAITTAEGCKQEADVKVATKYCGPGCSDLYMPNAFSPNKDGDNDFFMPMNPEDISGMEMSIYNRFGERIFYTNKTDGMWDGYFKDRLCDMGNYFYYLKYRDCKEEIHVKKGDLVLLK